MLGNDAAALAAYGVRKGLIAPEDTVWAVNQILQEWGMDGVEIPAEPLADEPLETILGRMLDKAVETGCIENDITSRDLLDTRLMGALTPRPSQVIATFWNQYAHAPRQATDWYYQFCQDTDYIRTYRVCKDVKWVTPTAYGELDITINLSKPEKDPRAIAAARSVPAGGYPACQLCRENEGYAGRINHPARQNLRLIPLTLDGQDWYFQYSPYVYYNEHCIILNRRHTPMKTDASTFRKLLDFVRQFPHYFVGSNADLPIVGGSILNHDHFQGGRYTFPMERAPLEETVSFAGYEDVEAGLVRWPMPVIRLRCPDSARLVALASRILDTWRGYSDPSAFIFAETEGTPHNTITPIARMRQGQPELDLVLRNNITTEEHPLGVFHPHQELHHIKKENIGLIEVMGLAVLPARLHMELAHLGTALQEGRDITKDAELAKHAPWAEELRRRYNFTRLTREAIAEVLRQETGAVFAAVLEHAGVFKRTAEGQDALRRFIRAVG